MKNIRKADLMCAGFNQKFVSAEESGQPTGYFYYTFEINDDSVLITDADDENDGNFTVYFFELNDLIQINDVSDLQSLVGIIMRNIKI